MPGSRKRMRKQSRQRRCMLKDVKSGRRAQICRHHASGAIRQRLLDLGFVPQAEIDIIRRAPLGDPIECSVASNKVTLRNSEAALIEVECDDLT